MAGNRTDALPFKRDSETIWYPNQSHIQVARHPGDRINESVRRRGASAVRLTSWCSSAIYHHMMPMMINPSDELPIYRQIMRQITEAIALGELKGGEKLASHRELSEQLVIAPLTVKKAYDELEALGFIQTQRGRGTFVCPRLPQLDRSDQIGRIQQAARRLLLQAHLAGLRFPEVLKILREAGDELADRRAQEKEKV